MSTIKEGKLLYHQTALSNLQSIIENGLMSRNDMILNGFSFCDVADQNIISGRSANHLEKYVPFHFHPRTIFDYRIRAEHPNENFIYICVSRDYAKQNNTLILPEHPLSNKMPKLYSYEEGIKCIDWDIMEITQGQPGYNSNVRMAECLFTHSIPANKFHSICVKNIDIEKYVRSILNKYQLNNIYVNIQKYF